MVYDVILLLRQSQMDVYNFAPVHFIQDFLTIRDDQIRTQDQLYKESLRVEPREEK